MRNYILSIAFVSLLSLTAYGWGKTGHSTIAMVAESHLSDAAKAALKEYVGVPLAGIASDADTFRSVWTMDLGFVPSNPEDARVAWLKDFDFSTPLNISPWSHSITVNEKFVSYPTDNLKGKYINNIAYYVQMLSEELSKNAKSMDPYERYKAIALITHFIGDMHCPVHIVYLPTNTAKGHIDVKFKGKTLSLHKIWDSSVINEYSSSFVDMATLVDTASEEEISQLVKGNVFDWAGECGRKCWDANVKYHDGDVLPGTFAADNRELLFSQLRNAGYRLAKVLNEIFK